MRLITIHSTLRGTARAVVSDAMGDEIDELIDAVTVGAYGEDEQLWAFRQAFENESRFPFAGRVVGVDVQVESIDYAGEERRGLVAHCRRDRELHAVSLLDVAPIPPVHGQTSRLLDAYRRWSGAGPLPQLDELTIPTWRYPGFAAAGLEIPSPRLALFPRGDWDPRDEYWGEPLIAFETRGPGLAHELYEVGVAVAEASLPSGFNGALPRWYIDNRPFLRCLHGLALCAWRQRRWDDAAAMFVARVWLDPAGSFDALACLDQVRQRQRWTRA